MAAGSLAQLRLWIAVAGVSVIREYHTRQE